MKYKNLNNEIQGASRLVGTWRCLQGNVPGQRREALCTIAPVPHPDHLLHLSVCAMERECVNERVSAHATKRKNEGFVKLIILSRAWEESGPFSK